MTDTGAAAPATWVRVWAWLWAAVLTLTFVSVTVLTLTMWLRDPARAETNPVLDLGFLALGLAMAVGFAAHGGAGALEATGAVGTAQAGLAAGALALTGVAGRRVEPAVGGLMVLAAAGAPIASRTCRRALCRTLGRPRWSPGPVALSLVALSLVAAPAGAAQVIVMIRAAGRAGPSCFLGGARVATASPSRPRSWPAWPRWRSCPPRPRPGVCFRPPPRRARRSCSAAPAWPGHTCRAPSESSAG